MSRTCYVVIGSIMLSSCAESGVLEPTAAERNTARAPTAVAQENGSARPAGGECVLVSRTPLSPTRRLLDWECHLQHLGLATSHVDETATVGPTGLVVTSSTIYTAANGDQLFVSYTGSASVQGNVASATGTETVTGGTGRFAGASGSLTRSTSVLLPPAFGGRYETSGTLSY